MIEFFTKIDGYDIPNQSVLESVLVTIARDYGLVIEYINIVIMSDEDLLEINKEFLKHDYYTDIITFNYADDAKVLEAELYISLDRVAENAKEIGVETKYELNRVVIHGMLHLAGMEDSSIQLKTTMRSIEDKYLRTIPFHVKPDINILKN
jgi:probable rRNA maturation factor